MRASTVLVSLPLAFVLLSPVQAQEVLYRRRCLRHLGARRTRHSPAHHARRPAAAEPH